MDGRVQPDVAAARGVVFITAAKLYFIATSFLVQFALPSILGRAALFGLYAQASNAISILNNVLITGTIQTVARFTARDEAEAPRVLRRALACQIALGAAIAAALFAGAPLVADFARKPALATYLRVASPIVLCYATYAALVGSLNGRRLFRTQAGLDATFSTLRAIGILGLGAAFSVGGAFAGWAGAAAIVLAIALLLVGRGERGGVLGAREYARSAAPLFAYHLVINLTMLVDVLFLSRFSTIAARDAGLGLAAAQATGNTLAGYYRAAQTFALLPYQAILSVAFVAFPLVSRLTARDDRDAARATVRGALRFTLLFAGGAAAAIAARPEAVLRFVYPADYAVAGPCLAVLSGGFVAFALFMIASTALNAAGHTRDAMVAGLAGLAALVAANVFVVPGHTGPEALVRTAGATAGGMTLGLASAAYAVRRRFGAAIPWASGARVVVAAAVAIAAGRSLPWPGRVATVAACLASAAAFFATLVALRELRAADAAFVARVLGRKPAPPR